MDMHGGSSSNSTCSISMLWNWNTIDACFLSESWHIANNGMFAASCIGVVLLVLLLEALRRVSREYDQWILRNWQRQAAALSVTTSCCDDSPSESGKPVPRAMTFRATPLQQLIRSVVHAVSFGVAYIIMLLVMSYNGYIIFSVIIGAGLGKFLCDWMEKKMLVGSGQEETAVALEEPTVCCG